MDDVFEFYINNKDGLTAAITKKEEKRLQHLIEGSIFGKFDPGEQELTITAKGGGGTTYTTHVWISIFGDCIRVAKELDFDITPYRRQIINYIPFAYSEHLNAIFSLVKNVGRDDIEKLMSIYRTKQSDLWRHNPRNFIEACEKYKIRDAVPILREFIEQTEFSIYDRVQALKTSEFISPDPNYLKIIFDRYESSTTEEKDLAENANELLITNHQDVKSIKWRLEELKVRAFTFTPLRGVHTIGPREHELHDKEFASPLLKLKKAEFEQDILDLLRHSFSLLDKEGYWDYAQYLWQVVYSYYDNLKEVRDYSPLKKLEAFIDKYSSEEGVNWFKYRLKELKRSYLMFLGKPTDIVECIKKYHALKDKAYNEISSPYDLYETIKEIIDKDLRNWVEGEGAYSFIVDDKIWKAKQQKYEDLIQRTVKAQLGYALLRRGFRDAEIIREPQLLDGRRLDFLVSYGFIGPIIIEVKLSTNPDLGSNTNLDRQKSYKNFVRYMQGYKAHYGIFLVFDNKRRSQRTESWQGHLDKIKSVYEQINNVTVLGMACV